MSRREISFVILFCCASAAAVAFYIVRNGSPDDSHAGALSKPSAQFVKEYEQVRVAEKITDKLQRCLAYPDPLEFHWDPKVVEAYCRLSLREMISAKEISDALDKGRPDIIDKAFSSYLEKTYQEGEHGFLIWTYWWMFQGTSPNIENITRRWVEMDADSPYALAARGTYYVAAAWQARGDKFASDTPESNFTKTRDLAAKAKQYFDEVIQRSPRMIEAYYGIMNVAQLTGDHALLEDSAKKALELDPAEKWIYDRWIMAVEPKWGGSIQQLKAVANQASEHASVNPLLKLVAAEPICSAAESQNCADCGSEKGRERAALDLYQRAFKIGPVACALNYAGDTAERMGGDDESVVRYDMQAYRLGGSTDKLLRSTLALQRLGETTWALESLDMLLEKWPKYAQALLYRGWILEGDHRPVEAEKAFRAVLQSDPQSREANTELVGLYMGVLHQRAKAEDLVERLMKADPHNARVWLLEAALDKGGDEKQCQADLEKYLALVDQTTADSYEQRDIDRAKARLAELKHARVD